MIDILLIEDDLTTPILIEHFLKDQVNVIKAINLNQAKEKMKIKIPKMIILDLHLPDGSGFDFLSFLEEEYQEYQIPVLMLTVSDNVEMKIKGFSYGIYDYIVKPFSGKELKARVEAHLKRAKLISLDTQQFVKKGDFEINHRGKEILYQGNKLELTPIEYKLLSYFILNANKAIERNELAYKVWKKRFYQSRTIDKHISVLRRKIPEKSAIETISRYGYKFKNQEVSD